ncbi:MAG: hypothetical protein AAF645_08865 [Myxococcota bacterium]
MQKATSHWHAGDITRGLGVAAVPALLVWVLLRTQSASYSRVTPVAWGITAAFVLLFVAFAAGIWLRDAREPAGKTHVFRTRELSVFAELIIAGFGAILFAFGAFSIVDLWIESPGTKTPFVVLFLWPIALPMLFWRPKFVLDTQRRTLKRYAFGEAIPLRKKSLPYDVEVILEEYWVGRQSRRMTGYMIRGRTTGGTFELEFLPLGTSAYIIDRQVRAWQQAFARSREAARDHLPTRSP